MTAGEEKVTEETGSGGVAGLPESYRRWRASRLGRITDAIEADLLFDLLGPVGGRRVLDAGCGDGVLAAALAARGADVTGLDPDPAMLAFARERAAAGPGRFRVVEGRLEKLPFGDAAFDVVVAVTVLCFIPDAGRAVAEMARVLKRDGRLAIGELGRWSFWAAQRRLRGWLGDATWRAAKFRTGAELRTLAAGAGLESVETRGAVFYPPFAPAAALVAKVDSPIGRHTTFGAAFVALLARKP